MPIEAAKLLVFIGAETEEAQAAINTASQQMQTWGKDLMKTGAMMTAGVTVPMVMVGKQALSMGVDYDRAMGVLRTSTGASGKEMDAFGKLAQKLGSDLTLPGTSAGDAAEAMLELGKAGLDVNDIMTASRGVLEMSAAGQLSNAAAAEVTANALNAFNLAGSEASRVADLFAAGANASSAEVLDMADAFKMSAAVFSAAGVPIEDLTTEIALMSNAGIQGSDAGTSLKQMLLSLQAPSNKAANLMSELGISIYDMNGNLMPTESLIRQFSEKLGGLTQEQRNAALATIFGSDAVRAANVVLMGGVDAYQKMEVAVTEVGAAEKLAAAQTEGLAGASDALKSSMETLMQDAVLLFHEELVDVMNSMAGSVNAFTELDDSVKKAALSIVGITGAVGPAMTAMGGMMYMSGQLGATLATLPKYLSEIKIGLSELRQGAKVFEVMAAGGGKAAAALGVVAGKATLATAGIGALVIAWMNWDEWVLKPNLEHLRAIKDELNEIYGTVQNNGGSTIDILVAYRKELGDLTDEQIRAGNTRTSLSKIDQELIVRVKKTGEALAKASNSQEEYNSAMEVVAETEGLLINSNGDLVRVLEFYGQKTEEIIVANWMLSESEWEEVQAVKARKAAAEEMYAISMPIYDLTLQQEAANQLERQAALDLAEAQQKLSDDLGLVRDAYDLNLISYEQYTYYLELARQGVLDLTDAEEEGLETAILDAQYKQEIADAAREMAEAVGEAKAEQLDLAQSFKGATEADYARQMIKSLTDEIARSGDPTGQLTATVEALGLKYGEMTESSIRASEAWPALEAAMQSGIITGGDAIRAVSLFDTQVESGKMSIEDLFQSLGIAPEVYQPFIDAANRAKESLGGTTSATDDWHSAMSNITPTLQALSSEQMAEATKGIEEVGSAMMTAATEAGGFATFALKLQEIAENISLFNEGLGKTPGLLEAFSGDDAANAITGLKDIGEAMRNAATGEGGVKLLAEGMESITGSLGILTDESIIEGVGENLTNLGLSMSEMAVEGGGIALFSEMMNSTGDSMATISEKATAIQQALPGFGQAMQQTAEQNLAPFRDMASGIVLEGLSPTHSLLDTIQKTDLPKFDEALKIALEQYLTPFQDKIVALVEDNFPELMECFKGFIEIVEKAKLKVVELHNAIDALPSYKRIVIDVVQTGSDMGVRQAGGPVYKGNPYIVGEKGPELFIPAEYGRILSNQESREAISNMRRRSDDGNGGGNTYQTIQVTSLGDADSIGDSVMTALQRMEMLYGPR